MGDKKELIKSMYKGSFELHKENRYGTWDREAVDVALDWLFHYTDENHHEVMELTNKQAKRFLIWFRQIATDTDTRRCVISTLIHFYDHLVNINWSKNNPFRKLKEEGGLLMKMEEEE
jgi:site-specific recombinase XerD